MIETIKNFILKNPQVSAAIITATCGIVGVFLNIWINVLFRNRDYKNKNTIHNIEILENFYIPLKRYSSCLIKILKKFDSCDKLEQIIAPSLESKYDIVKTELKTVAKYIDDLMSVNKYQYIGDYKLYDMQTNMALLVKLFLSPSASSLAIDKSKKETIEEIGSLIERIEKQKIKLMSKNFISYVYNSIKYIHKKRSK